MTTAIYGHPDCLCSICGDPIPDPEEEDEDYQLIIEGEPALVEAIAQRASLFLDVQEEGKDIPLPLRPGMVRRTLRILPPSPSEGEGQIAA